jgi:benzodiazapine receptor
LPKGAGILGSFFTAPKVTSWYAFLDKPAWNPPSWLFAPVWTLLFLLMSIALYRVWRTGLKTEDARESFWLFIAHLGVNIIWSLVFFGLQSPGWGVVVILTLLAFIAYLIFRFYRIDKLAG